MLFCRQSSAVFIPASPCFKIAAICFWLNRLRFTRLPFLRPPTAWDNLLVIGFVHRGKVTTYSQPFSGKDPSAQDQGHNSYPLIYIANYCSILAGLRSRRLGIASNTINSQRFSGTWTRGLLCTPLVVSYLWFVRIER